MPPSIVEDFDRVCFQVGDQYAIELEDDDASVTYFEIQEYSKNLACQLYFRLRPDYVLVDCQGWASAEAVATLACMRLRCPFVPVSCLDQHRPGRMEQIVKLLKEQKGFTSIVAVTVCENDRDPILSVFQGAGVHSILYLDKTGMLREQLQVLSSLPSTISYSDELYVLFTSGTSSNNPKAVVGSHKATRSRIKWFLNSFSSSTRIGRRTKLTFVDGVTELWCGLLDQNAALIFPDPLKLQNEGIQVFLAMGVTQLLLLPSQLSQLLLLPKSSSLERVIVSGEPCSAMLLQNFQNKYPGTQLINLYGQTETTGDILCADLGSLGDQAIHDGFVAVGTAICDAKLSLDKTTNELFVSGPPLANGYLGEGRFERFATGDVAFCHDNIWYIKGRLDDVRKRNGIWTSPVEIEAAFLSIYPSYEGNLAALMLENRAFVLVGASGKPPGVNEHSFSREHMHQSGIPWNLVPDQILIAPHIPKKSTGAGKVDRNSCKKIVLDRLKTSKTVMTTNEKEDDKSKDEDDTKAKLHSAVSKVLDLPGPLDGTVSFVELGGDSARSISLLYLLRQNLPSATSLTATTILTSNSLDDILMMLRGEECTQPKRQKLDTSLNKISFVPQTALGREDGNTHRSFGLKACVDCKTLVFGQSIFAACQGGALVKISYLNDTGILEKFYDLTGWMIQADLVRTEEGCIIVCAHSPKGRGRVLSLSPDFQAIKWSREFDKPIKATPYTDGTNLWVIVGGDCITILDVATGENLEGATTIHLPHPTVSSPVRARIAGKHALILASADWETGLMIVDTVGGKVSCHFEGEVGPVHKEIVVVDDDCDTKSTSVLLVDSYGFIHSIDLDTMTRNFRQVASVPLSSPLVHGDSIFVGDYSGTLTCLDRATLVSKWDCDCEATIYTKPAVIPKDGSIVVCTTAGHVLKVCPNNHCVTWRYRLGAEIWSDPVVLEDGRYVGFGARDSQWHLVKI